MSGAACAALRNQCRAVSYSFSDHGCHAYAWGKSPGTLNNEYTGNVAVSTPAATALDLASCQAWCDATFSTHTLALAGCKSQSENGATTGCQKMKQLVDAAPPGTCTAATTPQPPPAPSSPFPSPPAPPAPPPSAPQQCFEQVLTTAGPQAHRQCRSESPYLQTEITTLEDCFAAWNYFNDNDIDLGTATAPPQTPFRINLGFMSTADRDAATAFATAQGANVATSDLSSTSGNYPNWPSGCTWQGTSTMFSSSVRNRLWWWPVPGQIEPNNGATSWDTYYVCKVPCV